MSNTDAGREVPAARRRRDRLPPRIPDHELLQPIGHGAYGEVWLARSALGTMRAVKAVYREDFENDRPYQRELEGIRRFEPISRTHENLVDVLHVGHNEAEGWFYYVMELADSAEPASETGDTTSEALSQGPKSILYKPRTLSADLHRRGRLPFDECVNLGVALASALDHLHRQGLVHRDIKPSNVIFVNGVPKLVDIGLVTSFSEAHSVVGTLGFVAPEGPGTPQADLYSLGKVLYEISTGKDRRHYPEPLTELGDLPDRERWIELDQILQKACDRDPARRYESAAQMLAEFALLRSGASLKRLRRNERVLARLKRLVVPAGAIIALSVAAWIHQRGEARRFKAVAAESHRRLIRLVVANGERSLEEGDLFAALPWFVHSMRLAQGIEEEPLHRQRVAAVLRQCPGVIALGLHQDAVNSAEFSPDGRRLVSTSDDGTARIWNATTGEPLTPPLDHGSPVNEARFSPDGHRVVTAGDDGTARVWDAATGKPMGQPLRHADGVTQVSFSPDDRWILTASADHSARIWDASTGSPLSNPMSHTGSVDHAAFSPDGRLVVTASDDGTARLWRTPGGEPATPPLRHGGMVRWASFSPDGRRVATASDDGTARLWESSTGKPLLEPIRPAPRVVYVTFSPDGERLLTCGGDEDHWGAARVWDVTTGEAVSEAMRHPRRVKHASFSPDGRRVATASHDGTVRLWEADSGTPIGPPFRHRDKVWSAVFSPAGHRLLTAGRAGLWRLWDVNVLEWANPPAPFRVADRWPVVAFDGEQMVGADSNGWVRTWPVLSNTPARPPLAHPAPVTSIRLNRDRTRVMTGCADGKVRVWNAATGVLAVPAITQGDNVLCIALSPDNRWIASAGMDRTLRIWNAATGAERTAPLRYERTFRSVAFSPDSASLVTCSSTPGDLDYNADRGEVRVWDASTLTPITPPLWHQGRVTSPVTPAAFSPDGRHVVAGCKSSLPTASDAHIWDARTGMEACPPLKVGSGVGCVAFSPDGRRVLTGANDGTVRLWDTRTGLPMPGVMRHRASVNAVCFSPDGRRVLTGSMDQTARLWDAATGEALGPPLPHNRDVALAGFSPDGGRLFTAERWTGAIRVWSCPTDTASPDWLALKGRLLAGVVIDPDVGSIPLTPTQLEAEWRQSRASHTKSDEAAARRR